MLFGYFILFVALVIETVGAYYSVTGLAAIFSGAVIPILIMGGSLEVGKVTAAVWLKMYWERASITYKLYLVPAVAFLMVLTSMGIFGFLSKAHSDQSLVSGDSQAKVAIYDEKIRTAKENIEADRKQLRQMDEAVDQVMGRSTDEKGADKANAIRRSQQRDRTALAKDIEANQKLIISLNEEAAPLRAENRKVEADVGPIKYIAALIYGDNPDANILERAVRWVIILIVAVFDPLALVLILAAQQTLRWEQEDEQERKDVDQFVTDAAEELLRDLELQEAVEETPEVDRFAYLKKPFVHFMNLKPMVARPEKSENTIMEDTAAAVTEVSQEEDRSGEITEDIKTSEGEPETKILATGVDIVERPGDYLTPPEPQPVRIPEAAPAPNRGVMHSHLAIQADNGPDLGKPSNASFGNEYPVNPEKGDLYLRTDFLPNRLFKYNGVKWIEVDKNQTDVYAYEEQYIKHLIDEIDSGRYDPDTLTDIEREQIQQYLSKNA